MNYSFLCLPSFATWPGYYADWYSYHFLDFTEKSEGNTFRYYVFLAVAWTLMAVVFDYLFIVKAFKPADGY